MLLRTTRSDRVSRPPAKLTLVQHHLHTQAHRQEEYTTEKAKLIAIMTMCCNNEMSFNIETFHFVHQSYSLTKDLKKFGQKGRNAMYKDMKQLYNRVVFELVRVEELTELEKRCATMESLIFLVEKRNKSIKGRACANGSSQWEYTERDEAADPRTTMTESFMITAIIDAKQRRDVSTMMADIPSAFMHVDIDKKEKGESIVMKIRGLLAYMLK